MSTLDSNTKYSEYTLMTNEQYVLCVELLVQRIEELLN